jgi:hypothetical protein
MYGMVWDACVLTIAPPHKYTVTIISHFLNVWWPNSPVCGVGYCVMHVCGGGHVGVDVTMVPSHEYTVTIIFCVVGGVMCCGCGYDGWGGVWSLVQVHLVFAHDLQEQTSGRGGGQKCSLCSDSNTTITGSMD